MRNNISRHAVGRTIMEAKELAPEIYGIMVAQACGTMCM